MHYCEQGFERKCDQIPTKPGAELSVCRECPETMGFHTRGIGALSWKPASPLSIFPPRLCACALISDILAIQVKGIVEFPMDLAILVESPSRATGIWREWRDWLYKCSFTLSDITRSELKFYMRCNLLFGCICAERNKVCTIKIHKSHLHSFFWFNSFSHSSFWHE